MLGTLLLLLVFSVTWSWAVDYELLIEDPDIFSPCTDGPPGSITAQEAFDMDHLTMTMESDIIHISGNLTVRWEAEPTDRVAASLGLFYFNRGTWEPTVFTMSIPDFCPLLYDKNQSWFKYYTMYISNRHDVEHLCFSSGTVFVHDPFDLKVVLQNFRVPIPRGRYKIVISLQAISHGNVPRSTCICLEIRGELLKSNERIF